LLQAQGTALGPGCGERRLTEGAARIGHDALPALADQELTTGELTQGLRGAEHARAVLGLPRDPREVAERVEHLGAAPAIEQRRQRAQAPEVVAPGLVVIPRGRGHLAEQEEGVADAGLVLDTPGERQALFQRGARRREVTRRVLGGGLPV